MKKHIEAFKQYLTVDKKASKNTVESYIRDLNQFSSYCTSLKITSPQKVKTATVDSYLETLTNAGRSDSTRARITASLRAFFRYLINKSANGISNNNETQYTELNQKGKVEVNS